MSEQIVVIQKQIWNVFESGSGTPIVFLHNGGGTLWNWIHQLEYFSPKYRVIAPDLPGFGRSYRPTEPLTLEKYVAGLEQLLTALNCPKPILVGNCIGSAIALEYTLRHPEKVAGLALFNVCGGLPMLNPYLRFWASIRPNTALGRVLHQNLINIASHPALQRFSVPLLYAQGEPQLHPKLEQFVKQQRQDQSLRASLYWLVMGLDSFSVFSQTRQKPGQFPPTLLGWGAQNRTLTSDWAFKIADWLKPEHFLMIEDAGHMPMYEQPEQISGLIDKVVSNRIISS